MKNALADIRFTLDLPEDVVAKLTAGKPDDGSNAWYEWACHRVEDAVRDDLPRFMDHLSDGPEVEVMA
jgi:hypothetical protein